MRLKNIDWNEAADEIERLSRKLQMFSRYRRLCGDLRAERLGVECDVRLSKAIAFLRKKLGLEV